jgi:tetratricopeptide (TPR) repeat protein
MTSPARPLIRRLLAVVAGSALVVLLLLYRAAILGHSPAPAIARVRAQLALGPVLSAEAALQRSPNDPSARLRLARACSDSGDPAGAALALYALVSPPPHPLLAPSPDWLTQYARCCVQVGWLEEAAAALRRLPAPPARERLDLAAAYAGHGQAARTAAVLDALRGENLKPDEWLDGAITWYHCGRLEQAAGWARHGAALAPDNPAAAAVLAHCLLASGQPEAALRVLPDQLAGQASTAALLDYWRARAQVRCRDAALRQIGCARLARVAGESGDAAAAFEAGRAFLLGGEAARAVPLLSRAAVSGYQDVLCYEMLARAYEALGQPAAALWARARSQAERGQFAEAGESLRRSLELDPARPMAYVDRARALEADGKPRGALAVLRQAEQAVPGSMDVGLLKARLLLHLERVPEVIQALTGAAALDAKRANEPLGNLGTVFYDSQQYDRAIPTLERAVQLEDADAHSHFYLGRIYARRLEEPGRAEEALDHLLRAARLQPDYSRPWMEAAAVLQRMGDLPEAAACLRRAIDGESQSDAPYVRLAQLLQLQGRLPERELVLRQYAAIRDHDLTRTGLEKQTRDNPRDVKRRFALGDLLLREGRPEKALPELLAAAGMRPGWKQAQLRLADTCALLGYDDLRQEAERAARSVRE